MANLSPDSTVENPAGTTPARAWWTKAWKRLPLIIRALRLSWQAAPRLTLFWLVLLAAAGLLPAATVRVTRRLIDAVAAGLEPGGQLSEAAGWAGLMAGLLVLTQVFQAGAALLRSKLAVTVEDYVTDMIHQAAIRLDLGHFESPDFHDRLYRARTEASRRPMELLESCGGLVQNSLTLLAMGAILVQFGLWMPVLLVIATLPGALAVTRTYIREHRWRERVTAQERRAWYYDWLLTAAEPAAELRAYGLGHHFRKAYAAVRAGLRSDRLKLARQQNVAELLSGVFALAVLALALLLLAGRASEAALSLGQLAMVFHAFQLGLGLGRSLLGNARQIFTSSLFLENLIVLLDQQPTVRSPDRPQPMPADATLRFRDVTFRYPDRGQPAIRNLDLEIAAGAVVALVGPNGSGKSTLAKLLVRLYDPDTGGVEIGGTDIRRLSLDELRQSVALLSQNPARYNATARQNVGLGNVQSPPERQEIERAVRTAGADDFLAELPQGLDNMLGRWFQDGAELSGGQWQRIATARALVRSAKIVVLDEPTSNMDPWSEGEWAARLREHLSGRTLILITHRLSVAAQADWVVVLEDGQVAEQGPHHQLRAKRDGVYAQAQPH